MAHGRTTRWPGRLLDRGRLERSGVGLTVAVVILAGADWGTRLAGDTVFPEGPLDEIAHLLTTLLVLWVLSSRMRARYLMPALIASVAIDLDHVPARLGAEWLTAGTPRPYTHSLLTIVVVLVIAAVWRRRRDVLLGVAIGLAIHFWRDLGEGESGVSLLWPFSDHSFQYPHGAYVAAMVAFVLIDAALCARRRKALLIPAVTATLAGCSAALAGCSTALVGAPPRGPEQHRTSGAGPRLTPPKLIWSDDFNGPPGAPPDPAKWHAVTGAYGAGSHELEYYTGRSSNVALDGAGHLVLTGVRETYRRHGVTRRYTSARIETGGRFETMYGELEARIKLPEGYGLWPAFWALGSDYARVGWPGSGEIDMMEALGKDPFVYYGSVHGPSRASPDGWTMTVAKRSRTSLAAGFHVYGVRWSPGKVVFTFDGVPYATRTPAALRPGERWVLDRPFYLLLDLAVGGEWPGNPDASTRFPARMVVDWVRVYSR